MSVELTKAAADVLQEYRAIHESFGAVERRRVRKNCELLRRVLLDLDFRSEIAAERPIRSRGLPFRSSHPDWAVRLADVLRNAEGRYSDLVRGHVFELSKALYAEAVVESAPQLLARLLAREEDVPVLSDVARELIWPVTEAEPAAHS